MPHDMKKHLFVFLSVIAFVCTFVSCEGKSVMSPGIKVSSVVVRTSIEGLCDTIDIRDSVNVGDTLRMTMVVNGYFDYLKSIVAQSDTDKVKVALPWNEAQMGVLTDDADPEHGKLTFKPDSVVLCVAVMRYVPRKSGAQNVDIVVRSNAEENYSSGQWTLNIGVR